MLTDSPFFATHTFTFIASLVGVTVERAFPNAFKNKMCLWAFMVLTAPLFVQPVLTACGS